MTVRLSHRKRPPFLFSQRARAFNLPCDPKITSRGSFPTYFAEFRMFPGPQEIAVTGDNSFATLFGRHWAVLFCGNNDFYLLQWDDDAAEWAVQEDPLLTLPEFTGRERSFTAAFDQAARLILAYELDGMIKVTRWDADAGAYVQNVNFAGHDPALLMDASVTRRVPDSDVILFYVDTDRTSLHYRVQRETYGMEHDLLFDEETAVEYPAGMILDQAQALDYRFELLVAHPTGVKRQYALVSDHYPIPVRDELAVTAVPGLGAHRQTTVLYESRDALSVTAMPGVGVYSLTITQHAAAEALNVTALPGAGLYVETTRITEAIEALDVTATPGLGVYDRTTFTHSAAAALAIGASPGLGVYREV